MKSHRFTAFLVSICLMLAPAAYPSEPEAIGRLSVEGGAQINGVAMPTGTTVYDGDRVSAGPDSLATITLPGGNRVAVTKNSRAQVRKVGAVLGVSLEQGGLGFAHRSGQPAVVEALGLLLRLAGDGPGSYVTLIESKAMTLTAVKGDVRVEGGNASYTVPAGKTMRFEVGESSAPVPQAPVGVGGNTFMSSKALIITAIAIGAALSIALPLALGDESVSP